MPQQREHAPRAACRAGRSTDPQHVGPRRLQHTHRMVWCCGTLRPRSLLSSPRPLSNAAPPTCARGAARAVHVSLDIHGRIVIDHILQGGSSRKNAALQAVRFASTCRLVPRGMGTAHQCRPASQCALEEGRDQDTRQHHAPAPPPRPCRDSWHPSTPAPAWNCSGAPWSCMTLQVRHGGVAAPALLCGCLLLYLMHTAGCTTVPDIAPCATPSAQGPQCPPWQPRCRRPAGWRRAPGAAPGC